MRARCARGSARRRQPPAAVAPPPPPAQPPPPPQPTPEELAQREAERQEQRVQAAREEQAAERAAAEEAARQKLEEQRKADERRKAEAERKAQEAAQKAQHAADAQEQSDLESELKRSLAAEEHVAKSGPALANWQAQITAKISRAWLRPPTARAGIECVLNVTQVPGGEVTASEYWRVQRGPGGARVDRGGRLSRLPPAAAAGPGALRAQPQDQL